ncbi:hypothetical protein MMYC01_203182 [Madurella mycetomatis]|uniref:Uncharacterized protein n=1 Tax=Madurella mycetomatis TaxID=100816 RepID=A0A175WEC2_9PEZI|nr:hypothetical protein MMYC01_203182 [Madurella mycetomatis]
MECAKNAARVDSNNVRNVLLIDKSIRRHPDAPLWILPALGVCVRIYGNGCIYAEVREDDPCWFTDVPGCNDGRTLGLGKTPFHIIEELKLNIELEGEDNMDSPSCDSPIPWNQLTDFGVLTGALDS